eukprot:3393496-Pyramimonas_sp.AAC.1
MLISCCVCVSETFAGSLFFEQWQNNTKPHAMTMERREGGGEGREREGRKKQTLKANVRGTKARASD